LFPGHSRGGRGLKIIQSTVDLNPLRLGQPEPFGVFGDRVPKILNQLDPLHNRERAQLRNRFHQTFLLSAPPKDKESIPLSPLQGDCPTPLLRLRITFIVPPGSICPVGILPRPVWPRIFRALRPLPLVAFAVVCFGKPVRAAETTSPAPPLPALATNALDWWSLRPIRMPAVPFPAEPTHRERIRTPIDAFIFSRLEKDGLHASPEADRRTLMRRVHFDLTGLPPDPAEVDQFVNDPAPDAYEQLVDRLLASPRYGERWARHWLDVARYGETHGYDKDQPRPNAWPYRDYVVRSLNTDKPYGRFVEEQVAGDVLWPGTEDGITALGFISAGPWDLIGHAEVPETKIDGQIARALDRDDMVANVLNTFCSVTVQCARCHDHKFDPISATDYYRLTAVFAALDRADRKYDPDPGVAARRRELDQRRIPLEKEVAQMDRDFAARGGPAFAVLDRLASLPIKGKASLQPENGWHSGIDASPDAVKWVQVDLGESIGIRRVVTAACTDDFNGIGDGFGFPARYRIETSDDPQFRSGVVTVASMEKQDVANPGIQPVSVQVPTGVAGRYVRWTATRLAKRSNDWIFALAEVQVLDADGVNRALGQPVTSLDSVEAPARWTRVNLTDGWYPGLRSLATADLIAAARAERDRLGRRLDPALVARRGEAQAKLEIVRRETALLPAQRVVYAGTIHHGSGAFRGTGADGGKPREIHVLSRGDVRKPGLVATPGTLRFLDRRGDFELPAGHGEGERRAALAHWLTDPAHPLTWRSIVNRTWQYHFGRGLVDSPNDFGRMGQAPSHPELLEWLAATFRDGDQSLKALHRLLVTSSTYRQASADNPAAAAIDADNRLLWRGQRRKLEAEAVRDSLLWVAGKLDLAVGGPSFQDFKVERPEHSPHYEYRLADPDDPRTHRRSIYRFLVRSQPQPFMATLDCADPSMSVDKRNETLNALQALALMNNRLTVAMARQFAARLERISQDPAQQVEMGFRLALARKPSAAEAGELLRYRQEQGLSSTCRVLLNLNEFTFID